MRPMRGLCPWSFLPALWWLLLTSAPACALAGREGSRIAVLDFEDLTGMSSPALGQQAADALSPLLADGSTEVVAREQVRRVLSGLPPVTLDALPGLAAKLGVEECVIGRVLKADVRRGTPTQAFVRLEARVFDARLGEFVRGAVGSGVSTPRFEPAAAPAMFDEALPKAVKLTAEALRACIVTRGRVLDARSGECVLGIGGDEGLRVGRELVAMRGGKVVGRLQVTSVTPRSAVCHASGGPVSIAPEDEVVALYQPALPRRATVQMGPSLPETRHYLHVVARMLRDKDLLRLDIPTPTAAASTAPNGAPAVLIGWSVPSPLGLGCLGFTLYRSTTRYGGYQPVLTVLGPHERAALDTADDRELKYVTGGTRAPSAQPGDDLLDTAMTHVAGIRPGATYYYRVAAIVVVPPKADASGGPAAGSAQVVVTDFSPPSQGVSVPQAPPKENR